MHRTIRFATYDDIPAIMPVVDAAREMMHASIHETTKFNRYISRHLRITKDYNG